MSSNGWRFEKVWSVSVTGNKMAFDGKFIWVTCSDGVRIFNYWGESSLNEITWENYDSLTIDELGAKLTLFKFIEISGGSYWIVRGGNKMYVSNAAVFNSIRSIDISTWEVSDAISTPKGESDTPILMNSNLCWETDKLWMVSTHPTSSTANPDQQKLYRYDGTWDFTYIPQRKSTVCTKIAGMDGSVYTTSYNNVGICKFNASTGNYISAIRVNAYPAHLFSTSERELFVASYGGMLSSVNAAGTVQHEMSTIGEVVTSVAAVPGSQSFWFVYGTNIGVINRIDKSVFFSYDNSIEKAGNTYYLSSEDKPTDIRVEDDWTLDLEAFTETSFEEVLVTPSFTYQKWNGTGFEDVTLSSYLFLLSASKLHCVRLVHPFYRLNKYEITGQAAIVSGDKQYFGEQG